MLQRKDEAIHRKRYFPWHAQVEVRYLALAKQVMQFEKARAQEWAGRAEEAARAQLRRPILLEDAASGRFARVPAHASRGLHACVSEEPGTALGASKPAYLGGSHHAPCVQGMPTYLAGGAQRWGQRAYGGAHMGCGEHACACTRA